MIIATLLILFLKGMVLGLIVTAPPGPIATLCIDRSLERSVGAGMALGLGAALGDACYALVAAAGLAMVEETVEAYSLPIAALGGIALVVLGVRDLVTSPVAVRRTVSNGHIFRSAASSFLLALTNPGALLSFGGLFAGFGLVDSGRPAETAMIVAGVFCGAMVWWTALSVSVHLLRDRISRDLTLTIRHFSGWLIIIFGVAVLGYAGWTAFS